MLKLCMTALAGGALAMPTARAATAVVDGVGGPLTLNSTSVDGVFEGASPTLTNMDLMRLHGDVQQDLGAGATNGKVSFALIDSTSDGLAFAALVDEQMELGLDGLGPTGRGEAPVESTLELNTDAPDSATPFINDQGFDLTESSNIGGRQTRGGTWTWDSASQGDGFAWGDLEVGDFLGFSFSSTERTFPGLTPGTPFQFLSFGDDGWEVASEAAFSVEDQFAFSLTVIPTPMAAGAGLIGLASVVGVRRRRM